LPTGYTPILPCSFLPCSFLPFSLPSPSFLPPFSLLSPSFLPPFSLLSPPPFSFLSPSFLLPFPGRRPQKSYLASQRRHNPSQKCVSSALLKSVNNPKLMSFAFPLYARLTADIAPRGGVPHYLSKVSTPLPTYLPRSFRMKYFLHVLLVGSAIAGG
jgi:hypothetical protein